jgi:hypothetical protein
MDAYTSSGSTLKEHECLGMNRVDIGQQHTIPMGMSTKSNCNMGAENPLKTTC